jgi:acyl-CoA thioester hydrolase
VTELENYPVQVHIPIQWGDMDAFNHVNNIQFFKYFESARIKYFEEIGLVETMKKTGIGPILAKTSSQFLQPLRYPDNVTAGTRIQSIGKTSFVMEYVLYSERNGLSARGEAIMVIFDYNASEKVPIPSKIIQAINEIENKSF